MKKLLALLLLMPAIVLAKGTVTTGGFIGPSPSDFVDRFNGISSSYIQGMFPRIQLSNGKRVETKPLGHGITLVLTKVPAGDAFKEITVRCTAVTSPERMRACSFGIMLTATSIDTSIRERDFTQVFSKAVDTGTAIHNQDGVDYRITVNHRNKSIVMTAAPDAPAVVEELSNEDDEDDFDTLQIIP